jgi:hypothetical protein
MHRPSLRLLLAVAVLAGVGCDRSPSPSSAPRDAAVPIAPSASAPNPVWQKMTALESDTGKGEILAEKNVPELWIPNAGVTALAIHRGSLWWSDAAGIHERPFDGEARLAVPGQRAELAADEDGVVFAEIKGPDRFELQTLTAGESAPRRLAAMRCRPLQLVTAKSAVVIASTCAISAVPKRGGSPRVLEPETRFDVSLTADGDQTCYVNGDRITCRSLSDRWAEPLVIAAHRAGPLLLEGRTLYWLEDAVAADVIAAGDFGRLVRWELPGGPRRVLTSMQHQAFALLHDEQALYYANGAGSVRRVFKADGRVQTLYNVGEQETPNLAIGGGYVYFSTHSAPGVHRFRLAAPCLLPPRDGQPPSTHVP